MRRRREMRHLKNLVHMQKLYAKWFQFQLFINVITTVWTLFRMGCFGSTYVWGVPSPPPPPHLRIEWIYAHYYINIYWTIATAGLREEENWYYHHHPPPPPPHHHHPPPPPTTTTPPPPPHHHHPTTTTRRHHHHHPTTTTTTTTTTTIRNRLARLIIPHLVILLINDTNKVESE